MKNLEITNPSILLPHAVPSGATEWKFELARISVELWSQRYFNFSYPIYNETLPIDYFWNIVWVFVLCKKCSITIVVNNYLLLHWVYFEKHRNQMWQKPRDVHYNDFF